MLILAGALLFGALTPPAQAVSATGIVDWTVPTGYAGDSGTGHITGTVTNSGVGLPGVKVRAYASVADYYNGPTASWTMTGPDGSYDLGGLPTGSYLIWFNDNGVGNYVARYYDNKPTIETATPVAVTDGLTTAGINATLAVAGHFKGTVKNASAVGVANIKVIAYASVADYYDKNRAGWAGGGWAQTAADGSYDVGGLPTGNYLVLFTDNRVGNYVGQFFNNKPSIESATPVVVTAGATTPGINATLAAAGHITGTVTNASAVGLPSIKVDAYRFDNGDKVGDTWTIAGGSYNLGGLPAGTYRIKFFDDTNGAYVAQYYGGPDSTTPVVVTAGATTPGINATLAAAGHVTGTVTNASAIGLPNITVIAYASDGSGGWNDVNFTQTGAGGGYDLGGLPAGSVRIMFQDDTGTYVQQYYDNKHGIDPADDVAVTAGATTPGIDAVLAVAGHVTGTVTNASTVGLGGINVTAYQSDGSGGWDVASFTQTAAGGGYDLGLPTGSYRIMFQDDTDTYVTEYYNGKYDIEPADDVAVTAPGTTSGINATLAVAGHVTGTVKNASAAGLGDIFVNVYQSDGSGGWAWLDGTQTAADGSYDLGGLRTGSYRIEFYDDSGDFVTQYYNNKSTLDLATPVAVTAGATTSGINATLAVAGHITGTVKNGGAVGLGGIHVNAYRDDGSGGWEPVDITGARTAADGTYDLGRLPTGSYRIGFQDDTGVYAAKYYNNKSTLALANDVAVTAGVATPGIDATLAPWPAPVITVTAPTSASSWPSGTAQTVSWTLNSAVSKGEFRIWLVSSGGAWYIGKQVLPTAGLTSYSTALTASVPAAAGYRAYVYWRPTVGSGAWEATAQSAAFTVTPINVTSPTAALSWPSGSVQTVSWTINPAVSSGEFRIWLVSSGGTWYIGKQVLPAAGLASYSTALTASVPAASGYRAYVYWRPTVGSGSWASMAQGPDFTVTPINITSPTSTSSWKTGTAQTVSWTVSPAVSSGEFRVWLVSSGGTWYVGKQVLPTAGLMSYSTSITVSPPAGSGYRACVYWRPTVGSGSWAATAQSAGFTVTP